MVLLHRWASGGSGGSSRVSAWILNPAAAAAAKSSAMKIQVIGGPPSTPPRYQGSPGMSAVEDPSSGSHQLSAPA